MRPTSPTSTQSTTDTMALDAERAVPSKESDMATAAAILSAGSSALPTDKETEYFDVQWNGPDDAGCPLNMRAWRKWAIVGVLALSCICVTCCSSMAAFTYPGIEKEWHISNEVATLSISMFVIGLGSGPLLLGPISEFVGRAPVLHWSFVWFFLLNFPVAFGNHVAIHMVFRFLTGFAGSAFLSVSGGAITDIFPNAKVATPMMVFSCAPFMGPILGPILSGFINQNQPDWRWTYYVILIWAGVLLAVLIVLVPETYDPQLLRKRAKQLRRETGDTRHSAAMERQQRSFFEALKKSLTTPFVLLTTQPMVLCLDLWSALILGILYLFFGGVPYVFRTVYAFNMQETGLAFIGIGIGQLIAAFSQPYFNKKYKAAAADAIARGEPGAPPESRLLPGMYGAVLGPVGLLLFGLTTWHHVHWIVPIIMSNFFGWGLIYAYSATFTYLVDAYRPVAASALASNSFARSSFAAGFPLFGQQLYRRLGPVGGTCLLAGLLFLCTPMPFIFYRIGARVRARSPFGNKQSC